MRRRYAAGLAVALLALLPIATSPPVARAATVCTGWQNTLVPPPTIRVMRTSGPSSGKVQTVDFRQYVKVVGAAEWPSSWPTESLRSGAIAIKQYAWYFTMNYRGGTGTGGCYDVIDTTRDQVYLPESRTPAASMISAVDTTWTTSLTKGGSFFATGYQAGHDVACGSDANGRQIFQHSARNCAVGGMSGDGILGTYYYPSLEIHRPPALPLASFYAAPAGSLVTARSSATIAWTEEVDAGATIAARSVSLVMSKPVNGACTADRWLPANPPWTSTAASPASVSAMQAGYCYRLLIDLTDSAGHTSSVKSGPILVDPVAPLATFTSPAPTAVVTTSGGSASVAWTESPATGTTISARQLALQYAPAPRAGSCGGAPWQTAWEKSATSPVSLGGLSRLFCYRLKLKLTDSAGHSGTYMSGNFITPASF